MSYKHQNLSGQIMPALVFLLRFGSSLQCDILSTLGIIHHNKTENATERGYLSQILKKTQPCVSSRLPLSLRHDSVERINQLCIVAERQKTGLYETSQTINEIQSGILFSTTR